MTDPFLSRQVEKKRRPFSPTLPDSFIPRPDQLNPLKVLLTNPSESKTLVIAAKDGLGGMGKTSLALALAQDDDVKAAFPDGILWATLGADPDLLTPMGQWLLALDDDGMQMPTISMASDQLRHLIQRRRLLLIVDEVWSIEDLQPFQVVEDTDSQLLVTTRDVIVPNAQTYLLGEMTASQSQQLFETQLKQSLEQRNRKDALQFAKTVGYLPLSLHLGVSQIKNGLNWTDLMTGVLPQESSTASDAPEESGQDMDGHRPKLGRSRVRFQGLQNLLNPSRARDLQHQSRQACLMFCLQRLPLPLRLRLASLGLFPRNTDITPQMAGTMWGLAIADARQQLQALKLQGFLTHGDLDAALGQSYSLHPVMRDMAKWLMQLPPESEMGGLGMSWSTAHQQFLERYRAQIQDGQWHTIPADTYIHSHLLWHLEQAGWRGEIHQLLQDSNEEGRNAWYDVCNRMGLSSNFTVDIARAWQLAKQLYGEAPEHSTGLQVRYALTAAFVREPQYRSPGAIAQDAEAQKPQEKTPSVSQDLDRTHFPTHFPSEEWAFTKILLNAARYLPDLGPKLINSTLFPSTLSAQSKEEIIFELLHNVHQESIEMALALTENLVPNSSSVNALIRLVPEHSSLSLPLWQLLQKSSDNKQLVNGVACLAQSGAHNLHPDLLPMLTKLKHPLDRLLILEQIKDRLPQLLAPKVKSLRQDCLNDLSAQHRGLGQLPLTYGDVLGPIDAVTQDFLDFYQQSGWAIALCFEQYPSRRLDEAYSQVVRSRSEEKRSKAFAFLLPRLSEKHRREIWSLTNQLIDPECKARVLSRLHPYRPKAVKALLEVAKLFENHKKLKILVDSLPGPSILMEQIFSTILALSQPQDRWPYLMQVLPYLSPDQYSDLVSVIQETPFEAKAVSALLSQLSPDQIEIANGILAQVEAIPPVYERATALRQIVPHLPPSLKQDALEIAQQIQFPYARVMALRNFLPDYPEIAPEALDSLKNCHEQSPDDVFDTLVPVLPTETQEEAIALIAMIPDDVSRLMRLIRTLPYQPDLIDDIKTLVSNNPDLYHHCEISTILTELHHICATDLAEAPVKQPRTLDLMLAMLPLIDWVYSAPGSPQEEHGFCELVQTFLNTNSPILAPGTISSLFDFFYLIPVETRRAETLERLIDLTDIETVTPEYWMEWVEKLSRYQPSEFHWVFSRMVRFLMRFSNHNSLNQTLESVRSVREQWL